MFKPETDLIDPLDYLILGELPLEGKLVFDLYPDARTSGDIAEGVLKGSLTKGATGRRIATLVGWGLAIRVQAPGHSGLHSWQATPAGKKIYREWKERKEPHGSQ